MMRRTSIEAYERINEEGLVGPFQRDVYNILFQYGPMTAGEASVKYRAIYPGTSRGRNEIAKRIYELKNCGVVVETGIERECEATGFTCMLFDVNDQLPVKPEERKPAGVVCANEHASAARLIAWMKDGNRKPANTAFTEGPDRQVAYAVEWIFTQLDDARGEIRRLKNGELF